MPIPDSLAEYFEWVADHDARPRQFQRHFHQQIHKYFHDRITPGARVLEWGCGRGDLLASLAPSRGLGIDLSKKMLVNARERHGGSPFLEFRQGDVQSQTVSESFDYIVLNFVVGYLTDIQSALARLLQSAHPRTRLHITSLNYFWLGPLKIAQWLRMVTPQPASNWLSTSDLVGLLELAGWEVIETGTMQFCPFNIPLLTPLINRFIGRLPGVRWFGITQTFVARPRAMLALPTQLRCSVVVPARNEAGNVRAALERVPVLGAGTELIFVEGNSKDDTWDVIQREVAAYQGPLSVKALKQPGRGKWDAVRTGFSVATGDVLVIQDADLTAPPEDLPKFFEAIISGCAEFANGSRLVYPMESKAMRFLNLLGNKFFATALSYVLGQPVKDSLCGTKMILRSDYVRLTERIKELGDFDPFGDFNLLFGSALLDLRIRDIPVRYKDRTYGETNISRFKHGWLLLRMTLFGLFKIRMR
jgi:2-polyprenyl-3-methyl-5-hydroxy-6-metoxy-1,4-benzoquinol methylase